MIKIDWLETKKISGDEWVRKSEAQYRMSWLWVGMGLLIIPYIIDIIRTLI